MGLLTSLEKAQMPSDIKNKHEDWGQTISILERTGASQYRLADSPVDTYGVKFQINAIVHTAAQVFKANTLNLSNEFIEEGKKNNVQYVCLVLLETLGGKTISKIDKVRIDGKDFFIDSMIEYKHELLFTLKYEDF